MFSAFIAACIQCIYVSVCVLMCLGSSEEPEEAKQAKQEARGCVRTPARGAAVGVRRAVCVGL